MSDILNQIRALAMIINHAAGIGLPMPYNFRYDHQCGHLVLSMSTPTDVREWARWMEVDVASEASGRETYWSATGIALDAQIRVVAFSINADVAPDAVGMPLTSKPVEDGEHLIDSEAAAS